MPEGIGYDISELPINRGGSPVGGLPIDLSGPPEKLGINPHGTPGAELRNINPPLREDAMGLIGELLGGGRKGFQRGKKVVEGLEVAIPPLGALSAADEGQKMINEGSGIAGSLILATAGIPGSAPLAQGIQRGIKKASFIIEDAARAQKFKRFPQLDKRYRKEHKEFIERIKGANQEGQLAKADPIEVANPLPSDREIARAIDDQLRSTQNVGSIRNLYHGAALKFEGVPTTKVAKPSERAVFASPNPAVADEFSEFTSGTLKDVFSPEQFGKSIHEMNIDGKVSVINFDRILESFGLDPKNNRHFGSLIGSLGYGEAREFISYAIQKSKRQGDDALIIRGMEDLRDFSDQVAIHNPLKVISEHRKYTVNEELFNPNFGKYVDESGKVLDRSQGKSNVEIVR